MDDLSTRSLTIALTFVAVPLLLRAIAGGASAGGTAKLRYSNGARVFGGLVLGAMLTGAVGAGLQAGALANVGHPAALAVLLLVMMIMAMNLEFLRVNHDFGAAGITYRSPWSRDRQLDWKDVASVQWRPTPKWLDVVSKDDRVTLHLSPLLSGLAPFAEVALQRLPGGALEQDVEARAALSLMAARRGATLLFSSKRPSELVAELRVVRERT
jgi:hypothetical protein